jgi:DNA-binding NarL/FixJ family response regulator
VDDHPLVCFGLKQELEADGYICVGDANNQAKALRLLEEKLPDLVILDLKLQWGDGLELLKQIVSKYPSTRVLVLSSYRQEVYGLRTLRAGAAGYLMKNEASEYLHEAVATVLRRQLFVPPSFQSILLQVSSGKPSIFPPSAATAIAELSDRELEILSALGAGLSIKQVADKLELSPKTVESHKDRIRKKFDLPDGESLIRFAMGWLERAMV